ncbi:uncharacterized protein LOC127845554 isoform X1 [Dreissena polymorpha]|uniref:uncharacterized protein LOC127845554 isoform X1 n=2 Tax=Dreissena polymorpha TaxID=45954 RepID=UPI0022648D2C|nr:uncharacterized protein LOC127845554 isoform X1 [Dreissena polymorpha]
MFKHFIIVCILVFVWRFYRTSDYSSHIPDCETIDMEDSKDTVIVIGCGKLKGPQFIELFKGVGPIKVADDGNTLARINLQRQDGIVTYQNSELAKKAIATLNGKNVEGGKIEVVSAEQHFRDQTQRNGKATAQAQTPHGGCGNTPLLVEEGKGGKEGRASLVSLGAKTVSPVSLGRTGGEGRGEKAVLDFSEGFLEGVVKGKRDGIRPEEGETPSKAIIVREKGEKEGPACSACSRGRTVSRASRVPMGGVVKEEREVVPGKKETTGFTFYVQSKL